jgi:hypothetical protein
MISNWGVQYIIGKILLRAIRYGHHMLKKNLIQGRYEYPKFWDNKSWFWDFHLGVLGENVV